TGLGNACLAASLDQEDKPIFEQSFNLRRSMQSPDGYSLVNQSTGKIIGTALWNDMQRRFILSDKKGKYAGFLQATVLDSQLPKIYKQYLAYDQDSNYQGVIIKELGGMPLPLTKPPSLAELVSELHPKPLGNELGGQWQLFRTGNIALEEVPELEIRMLPWEIEDILDENQP
ncbi:MAG: hypothetical protein V1736_09140, partial [Pseudomonadota bacterium]